MHRLLAAATFTTLHSFDGVDGGEPYAGLTADAAGNFYGTIFKLSDAGFVLPGVPEPASWAMLIAGFGMVGSVIRRRRAVAAA